MFTNHWNNIKYVQICLLQWKGKTYNSHRKKNNVQYVTKAGHRKKTTKKKRSSELQHSEFSNQAFKSNPKINTKHD